MRFYAYCILLKHKTSMKYLLGLAATLVDVEKLVTPSIHNSIIFESLKMHFLRTKLKIHKCLNG